MRAFVVEGHDRPPAIRDVRTPVAGAGEVLVEVEACGLNFADLLMARGEYQERPPLPLTLGMEIAGRIAGLGPGADGPGEGARVLAVVGHGGLAETVAVPAGRCVPLPPGMAATDAAAFPIAYGTSHLALARRARLGRGETLLVLGAAGGVGLTAVELGALMGARVIAAARGAEKLGVARAAGAAEAVDTDADDLTAAVKALGGADVVYDPVGGPLYRAALSSCRPEARYLAIGFAGGVPEVRANHLLVKNVALIGHYWGGYLAFRPDVVRESLATLLGWYSDGRLRPHVSHVLPLDRAADGLELIRSRASTGKVVVTV
jgi:NADPH2:quinone reductase